ncbi:MAG TPA: tRNA (N(6)-L-threonylcarbamoyladenosine(37)-C(2))-methylthiotransferase MtaB, partial [Candidatus Bathyarchaeia archaeon]|nr:tRNA (N(6)-L-threonylcarbamoyladenosine(37)-C(2))-methylthiotransferase MtaB [Candidatus Bathyarchaeia archaeon]
MRIRQFKSFRIITFGCRVNQAESRMMGEGIAKQFGGQNVDIYKKADLVVINTCCVTGKAEKEVRKEIRRVKRENPECFLAVC